MKETQESGRRTMVLPRFLDVDQAPLDRAKFVILPAPFEKTVSYGGGTRNGPRAILEASAQVELWDEETGIDLLTIPVHTLGVPRLGTDPEAAARALEAEAARALDGGRFLLTLGGEHSVSLGPLRAVKRVHPEVGILQIDAHTDMRQEYGGTRFSHACIMRRAADDLGLPVVAVGIRAVSPEEVPYIREKGLKPFFAHALDPDRRWVRDAVAKLPQKVYVTFDIDGLDPAYAPGTGTPEPGGLSYRDALTLLREVTRARKVVSADIVEVAPIPGSHVTEFTAARLAAKIMVYALGK